MVCHRPVQTLDLPCELSKLEWVHIQSLKQIVGDHEKVDDYMKFVITSYRLEFKDVERIIVGFLEDQ
jgi:hypothetical protein